MNYFKEIEVAIKQVLKQYGFKKKGLNWYWEDEEIVKIFNIQRSQYSKKVYLNIGIKIKALEKSLSYTFPGSHIGFRLDHLIDKKYLDFENDIDFTTRKKKYLNLLESNPYDFFSFTGDIENIKGFIKRTGIKSIFGIAKQYLEL